MKDNFVTAKRDLDAAALIDGKNLWAARARGMLASRTGDMKGVVDTYTVVLATDPKDAFALGARAEAYRALGHADLAALDAAAAIKLKPDNIGLYLLLANIERTRGNRAAALQAADAVMKANPDNEAAFVVAGRLHAAFGLHDVALRDFDRAIAIKPAAYIYVNRSEIRLKSDVAGRMADYEAALKLDPALPEALFGKANILREQGDNAGALAMMSAIHGDAAENPQLLVQRGILQARLGHAALADKDFADAHAHAKTAAALNNLCWEKAIAGVALTSALADCDAALVLSPDASSILDSRGFALLRLGRLDESIATYDRALAGSPISAPSLFGRAVAEARKGDRAKAALDAEAATKANPDVRAEFATYGVSLPDAGPEAVAKTS